MKVGDMAEYMGSGRFVYKGDMVRILGIVSDRSVDVYPLKWDGHVPRPFNDREHDGKYGIAYIRLLARYCCPAKKCMFEEVVNHEVQGR